MELIMNVGVDHVTAYSSAIIIAELPKMSTYEPMKEPMGTPAPAYNPAFAQPSPMPLQNVAQHQQRSYDVAGAGGGSREEVVHNGDSAAESKAEVEVQEVENEKLGPGDVPEKHLDVRWA